MENNLTDMVTTDSTEVSTNRTVQLDSDNYNEFIRCLGLLKDNCNDVDIREGIIRQRSNNRTEAFEIDLTPLINDINLPITALKNKFDLFKMFADQDITVEINETKYSFSDALTTLTFDIPSLDLMDNPFINQEELDNIFEFHDEDILLETEVSTTISDRLKVISQSFNTNAVQIKFNGDQATISCSTQARDQHAKLIDGITMNKEIDNSVSNLVIVPFIIDHDGNIDFSIFEDDRNSQLISKATTSIGDVNISIFSRSLLRQED